MRSGRKKRSAQRRITQQKLERLRMFSEPTPPAGWVKTIRVSLGLSIRQLADRLGLAHSAIDQLEKRERQRRVSLETLEKVASAMECKVVYAIVPKNRDATLDSILRDRAIAAAARIVADVEHTMRLEAQRTSDKDIHEEVLRVAAELLELGDSRIWDVEKAPQKSIKKRR